MTGRSRAAPLWWPTVLILALAGVYLSQKLLLSSFAVGDFLGPGSAVTAVNTRESSEGEIKPKDVESDSPAGGETTTKKPTTAKLPITTTSTTKPIERRQIDDDDRMLLKIANDPLQKIHITHFSSTYAVPTSSPAYVEQMIVQESWKRAAIQAKQLKGLNIQFLDHNMPGDDASSPPFATRRDMSWWLDDVTKGKVPVIGENFHLAKKYGRGEIMMYTNADIGVMPDFYIRALDWAQRDLRTPEAQLDAMRAAARYAGACFFGLSVLGKTPPPLHVETCVEDTKVYYIHAGGFGQLWEEVKMDIALEAAKIRRKLDKAEATQVKFTNMVNAMRNSGSQPPSERVQQLLNEVESGVDWRTLVDSSFTMVAPSIERLNEIPLPLFAGTVTRMDVEVEVDTTLPEWRAPIRKMYEDVSSMVKTRGVKHPGNDCFIFHRDYLPEAVRKMAHPPGVRPFGLLLAVSWWDAPHRIRRITATKKDPWTFHVGIGLWGFDHKPWRDRASEDPSYTMFLIANYDRLSQGGFRNMFLGGPSVCKNSTTPWRSIRFCNGHSNEFCAGIVRFSCYYYFHFLLRDSIWYYDTCVQIYNNQGGRAKRPICDFCNFMFQERPPGSKRRFTCEPGKVRFCQGLPDEVCPDGPGDDKPYLPSSASSSTTTVMEENDRDGGGYQAGGSGDDEDDVG